MVEISLDGLPVSLFFAQRMDELIESASAGPHLVLCAEEIRHSNGGSEDHSYLSQAWKLAHVGYRCPFIVLQSHTSATIHPETLEGGLPLVASIRKPFKTHELLKTVCDVMAWDVPHGDILLSNSRVIPLARPQAERAQSEAKSIVATSNLSVSTPMPTSVGSLMAQSTSEDLTPPPPLPVLKSYTPPPPLPSEESQPQVTPPVLEAAQTSSRLSQKSHPRSLSGHPDLSPTPTQSLAPPREPEEAPPPMPSAPVPSQPSAEESFKFDFPELPEPTEEESSERDDQLSELSPPSVLSSSSELSTSREHYESSRNQSPVDEEEDWLDESGATVSTPVIGSKPPAEVQAENEDAPSTLERSFERSPSALEAEWLSTIEHSVQETSSQALKLIMEITQKEQHAGLSSADLAILIERIAWEVVPMIASDLIREQLVQVMSDQR